MSLDRQKASRSGADHSYPRIEPPRNGANPAFGRPAVSWVHFRGPWAVGALEYDLAGAGLPVRLWGACRTLKTLMSSFAVDLRVDLNTEDETGFPWTYLDDGADRDRVVPGRFIVAGVGRAIAVAQVVDVANDGLVRVRPVRGTVESNGHHLGATRS